MCHLSVAIAYDHNPVVTLLKTCSFTYWNDITESNVAFINLHFKNFNTSFFFFFISFQSA